MKNCFFGILMALITYLLNYFMLLFFFFLYLCRNQIDNNSNQRNLNFSTKTTIKKKWIQTKHGLQHLGFAPLRWGSILIKVFCLIPSRRIAVVTEFRYCVRLKEFCHFSLQSFGIHQRRVQGKIVGEWKRNVILSYRNKKIFFAPLLTHFFSINQYFATEPSIAVVWFDLPEIMDS